MDKTAVLGFIKRGDETRAEIVPDRKGRTPKDRVHGHVEQGGSVCTDSLSSYNGLERDYLHEIIDRAERYAQGQVHTNGIENFWSLLKRSLHGTHVGIDPAHPSRYLDEQIFRFNRREANAFERFGLVLQQIAGRRLTHASLTGRA